ncbi:MAG: T9SS type A sorting domain-containing protein [Bacteroidota bacterium]
MNPKIKTIFIFLTLIVANTQLHAQQSTLPSGGEATGTGGTVSYSIGQAAYITNTGVNGSVAEGVQQPYEISVITGIEQTNIHLSAFVYPNPVIDKLVLNMKDNSFSGLIYQLLDANGKLILMKEITETETTIPTHQLTAGAYFLKIMRSEKEIKSFKIIKNK